MLFLPFDNFTITTHLNAEQTIEKLLDVIEPSKNFRSQGLWEKSPSKFSEGTIYGYSFRINKIINYRNYFLPIIEGRICPELIGCQGIIQMKLHRVVMIFMLFCLGNFLPVALGLFLTMLANNKIYPLLGLAPLGMYFFAYFLGVIDFNFDKKMPQDFCISFYNQGEFSF